MSFGEKIFSFAMYDGMSTVTLIFGLLGNAAAQDQQGLLYYESDNAQALKWFRRAADNGDDGGQLHLAAMYAGGNVVPQDTNTAIIWYRKAADQGNTFAQWELGRIYEQNGDYTEAVKWYIPSAKSGNVLAQKEIGAMYEAGNGVQEIEKGMSDDQITEAKKQVNEWRKMKTHG